MSGEPFETYFHNLVDGLTRNEKVRALGLSGGDRPFPEPGVGDLDLFIYCTEIPDKAERFALLSACSPWIDHMDVGCLDDSHWGQGDRCYLDGVETWLLYFTVAQAHHELEETLTGDYLWRLDNYYYPLGRCAMWQTMRALYDADGMLSRFKARLAEYPDSLQKKVVRFHVSGLKDREDLDRAVQRKDVLFYHFAFDLSLDHFLQVVFALNRTFFPSRKRSEQYLHEFRLKPADCTSRLKRAVALGGDPQSIEESYSIWRQLTDDLIRLANLTIGDR